MSVADITPASTPFPYVWMADASVQDNSTKDRQFSGLHNDTSYMWACVDTGAGKRYWLVRTLSPVATYSFSLSECLTDRWTKPTRPEVAGTERHVLGDGRLARRRRDVDTFCR